VFADSLTRRPMTPTFALRYSLKIPLDPPPYCCIHML
jgi:hypothetical protein